jgi:cytochrome c oxidase subunit 3
MSVGVSERLPRAPVIPNAVLGTAIFLCAEAMLFAGLLSAVVVLRAGSMDFAGRPTTSGVAGVLNLALLLSSGGFAFQSARAARVGRRARPWLLMAALLGAAFLCGQGLEWIQVLEKGFSARRSLFGAAFLALVGIHGAHVVSGITVLLWAAGKDQRSIGCFGHDARILATVMYWGFVVAIWPLLYAVLVLG